MKKFLRYLTGLVYLFPLILITLGVVGRAQSDPVIKIIVNKIFYVFVGSLTSVCFFLVLVIVIILTVNAIRSLLGIRMGVKYKQTSTEE